jgi:protein kinase A
MFVEVEDAEDEAARLRRKASGRFLLNDFKFLSTLGTGTFGRVRLVKHKSEPPEAQPLALKCLKKSEIIRLK